MEISRQISNANICLNPCLAICAHGLTFVLVPLGFNCTAPWKPNKKLVIFARYEELELNICSNFGLWQVTCCGYKHSSLQLFCY